MHWSGHGNHNCVELVGTDGRPDRLTGEQFVQLFRDAGNFQPHLVFLSACLSGSVITVQDWATLRAAIEGERGAADADRQSLDDILADPAGFTGMALQLLRAGVPQVIAMRYEVGDTFARELAGRFYGHLLADPAAHDVDDALGLARGELLRDAEHAAEYFAVDHATPLMFGRSGRLPRPARRKSAQFDRRQPRPWPVLRNSRELDAHAGFVGRSRELVRLAERWVPGATAGTEADCSGVALIQGLAGLGKTALAAEMIDLWHDRFDFVLAVQAKPLPLSIDDFYRELHTRLNLECRDYREDCQDDELRAVFIAVGALDPDARYQRMQDNLLRVLDDLTILLVIDNYEPNLEDHPVGGGQASGASVYRSADPRWDVLLRALASRLPETPSRLILTSRHRPQSLTAPRSERPDCEAIGSPAERFDREAINDSGTLWLPLGRLPLDEAAVCIRTHPTLRRLAFADEAGMALVRRLLEVSGGHPLILDRLSRLAADRQELTEALDTLKARGWQSVPHLFDAAATDEDRERERQYLDDVSIGAVDLLLQRLSPDARQLLRVLSLAFEPQPESVVASVWADRVAEVERSESPAEVPPIEPLLEELHSTGLVTREVEYASSLPGSCDGKLEAYPTDDVHELVRERVAEWFQRHPNERGGRSDTDVRIAYGERYADLFEHWHHAGAASGVEYARDISAEAGRRALRYFCEAGEQAGEKVGNLAGIIITDSDDRFVLASCRNSLTDYLRFNLSPGSRGTVERCIGDAERRAQNPEASLIHYERSEALADSSVELACTVGNKACALLDLGRLDEAKKAFLKSAELFASTGQPRIESLGRELEALRIELRQRGKGAHLKDVVPAIEAISNQCRIWWHESLNGNTPQGAPDTRQLGKTLVVALDVEHELLLLLEAWAECLDRLEEKLQVQVALGQGRKTQLLTLFNRAYVLIRMGLLDQAESILHEYREVFAADSNRQARSLGYLGDIWMQRGDIQHALDLQWQSLQFYNIVDNSAGRATGHFSVALTLECQQRYADSAMHLAASVCYALVEQNVSRLQKYLRKIYANFSQGRFTFPCLDELLSQGEFAALARWLDERGVDRAALQQALDARIDLIRWQVESNGDDDDPRPRSEDSRIGLDLDLTRGGGADDEESPTDDSDELDTPWLFPVWFGTNRQPKSKADLSQGFTSRRSPHTYHGVCEVSIPRAHRFGSVGSGWFRRLVTWTDDRLKLQTIRGLDGDGFWQAVREDLTAQDDGRRQALVFLHGYNVSFEEAAVRAAQVGFDLKVPGATAFFSWPSGGKLFSYRKDGESIQASEAAITDFLVRFARDSGAERVHLIAHSMGNRGLLRAMQRIADRAADGQGVQFGQIFLAAPDVDVDVFTSLADRYPQLSERTTLYVSPKDKAVSASRLLHGFPRVGLTPPVTVFDGIDTIEVQNTDLFDLFDLNHGYFATAAGVLHDMFDLLRRNASPDERQRPTPASTGNGSTYWKLQD